MAKKNEGRANTVKENFDQNNRILDQQLRNEIQGPQKVLASRFDQDKYEDEKERLE